MWELLISFSCTGPHVVDRLCNRLQKHIFCTDWPSCLKVIVDYLSSSLSWAVTSIIWITAVVEYAENLLYGNTTSAQHIWQSQTHQEDTKFHQITFDTPDNWKPFQVTTAWSWLRYYQECAKLSSRHSGYLEESKIRETFWEENLWICRCVYSELMFSWNMC